MRAHVLTAVSSLLLVGSWAADAVGASGGPDAAGYRFVDQNDGSEYGYVDITATGSLLVSGDDGSAVITFPPSVDFRLYGELITGLSASTNGFLSTLLTDAGDDHSNDCVSFPAVPSAGGGSRIYALHDDLVSSVYYEHFDATEAEAIGFVGQSQGVSIVQWVGSHFSGGGAVDFQVVLLHGTNDIQIRIASDADAGNSSTTGLLRNGGSDGLLYQCNGQSGPTLTPGVTSVFWGAPRRARLHEIRTQQLGENDTQEFFELVGTPLTNLSGLSLIVIGDAGGGDGSGGIDASIALNGQAIDANGFFVAAEPTFTLGLANLETALAFENDDNLTVMLVEGFTGAVGDDLDLDDDGLLDVYPWSKVLDAQALVYEANPPPTTELHYGPPNGCGGFPDYCGAVGAGGGVAPAAASRCALPSGSQFIVGALDPANGNDSPGAANNCPSCGNGFVETGEDCDGNGQGAGGETLTCDTDCTFVVCGDGVPNFTAGEGCDDGDLNNQDDCPDDGANGGTCAPAVCGDGFTDGQGLVVESCDGDGLGNPGVTATCDADCTLAQCGDGVLNQAAGEVCDDGNDFNGDDCPDAGEDGGTCQPSTCGDGFIDVQGPDTEICDGDGFGTPGETFSCDADCTNAKCGDGVVNNQAGETCDDGGPSPNCNDDCTAVTCGDGFVNSLAGEQCDGDGRGNPGPTELCDEDCTEVSCGDGVFNPAAGEACDDGADSELCDSDCSLAECGDGYVNSAAGELCDDGNESDLDDCPSNCGVDAAGGAGGAGGFGADNNTVPAADPGCSCRVAGAAARGAASRDAGSRGSGSQGSGSEGAAVWLAALAIALGSRLRRRR